MPMHRKISGAILVLLWAALACNMPVASQINQGEIEQAVAGTLEALRLTEAPPVLPSPIEPPVLTPEGTSNITLATVIPGLPTAAQDGSAYQYITRSGDTVFGLAGRFGVPVEQIQAQLAQPSSGFLMPDITLSLPRGIDPVESFPALLPDGEVIYSPTSANFSAAEWAQAYSGYLNVYTEVVDGETLSGVQILDRVALETSISPRLLLAFLEYRSGWLTSTTIDSARLRQPIGFNAPGYTSLHGELTLVARQLTIGYYGWRAGSLLELKFLNGSTMRVDPTLNPGSVALQYLFATLYTPDQWRAELVNPAQFLVFYQGLFGDPWQRALAVEPLLSPAVSQPTLELPFQPGERWSLTGGPHAAWGVGSPWGALDFAPISGEAACTASPWWARAVAPGLVVRSGNAQVVLDLDGDGYESTGWAILYMHLAAQDRIQVGTYAAVDTPLGHPSCEGGKSTGTHVHIARKYNGEWLAADGPLPMVLSGYAVQGASKPYAGILIRENHIVTAMPDGSHTSVITR